MLRVLAIVLLSTGLLGTVLFVSGCAEDVCVAGVGDCDFPGDGLQTQSSESPTGASSTNIILYSSQAKIAFGNKVTITASGGKLPHTFSVEGGGSFASTKKINDTTTSVEYTAPLQTDYSGENETYIIVKVTDANKRTEDVAVIVSTHAR